MNWIAPTVKKNIDPVSGHACAPYFENPAVHVRSKDLQAFSLASLKVDLFYLEYIEAV